MVPVVTRSRPQVSFAHGALFVIRNELGVGNSLLLDACHTYLRQALKNPLGVFVGSSREYLSRHPEPEL
jgi:hypothetical protein